MNEGKQVESIEYLPSELVPRTPTSKNTIVDVRCEETGGQIATATGLSAAEIAAL